MKAFEGGNEHGQERTPRIQCGNMIQYIMIDL
jgi:hypothetical protein